MHTVAIVVLKRCVWHDMSLDEASLPTGRLKAVISIGRAIALRWGDTDIVPAVAYPVQADSVPVQADSVTVGRARRPASLVVQADSVTVGRACSSVGGTDTVCASTHSALNTAPPLQWTASQAQVKSTIASDPEGERSSSSSDIVLPCDIESIQHRAGHRRRHHVRSHARHGRRSTTDKKRRATVDTEDTGHAKEQRPGRSKRRKKCKW